VQVATILRDAKLDYIAVDSYFEALEIREVNNTPILLIGYTLPVNLRNMDFSFITLVVYDIDTIRELGRIGRKVRIHLKLDTGMARQGMYIEQLPDILDEIAKYKNIILEGICTHLASADESDNTYSESQIEKFKQGIGLIEKAGWNLKYRHISASAGSMKFSGSNFNALRLGIGLYGVNPLEADDEQYSEGLSLRLALRFDSRIILKKAIKKGDTVSYNRTFTASRDMTIGIVPVGYYEGLSRKLSNNYAYSYQGHSLPILGRVCMNLTIVDITDIDIDSGDRITIISDEKDAQNNVYELAKRSETITYECLTRLSESVRRVVR
ncbi:MAG: alanine racemase, partial [Candidatus Gracilibacteria bacterium]|nr:alanine racemase [Candidatus Gracilibacteria bacterium]